MTQNQRNHLLKHPIALNIPLGEVLGLLKLTEMKIAECAKCLMEKECEPCRTTITQASALMKSIIMQLASNGITKIVADEIMNWQDAPAIKVNITSKDQLTNQIKYN